MCVVCMCVVCVCACVCQSHCSSNIKADCPKERELHSRGKCQELCEFKVTFFLDTVLVCSALHLCT